MTIVFPDPERDYLLKVESIHEIDLCNNRGLTHGLTSSYDGMKVDL